MTTSTKKSIGNLDCPCGGRITAPSNSDPYCTNSTCGRRFGRCKSCTLPIRTKTTYCNEVCRDNDPDFRKRSGYAQHRRREEEDFTITDVIKAVIEEVKKDAETSRGDWDAVMEWKFDFFFDFQSCEGAATMGSTIDKCISVINKKHSRIEQKKGAVEALTALKSGLVGVQTLVGEIEDEVEAWTSKTLAARTLSPKEKVLEELVRVQSASTHYAERLRHIITIIQDEV